MEKVIIAGCRYYHDFERVVQVCDHLLKTEVVIVSGGAKGADALGERYAQLKGYTVERHIANWEQLGKMAGPIRNEEMVKTANRAIVFWDGRSRGTKNLVSLCKRYQLPIKVILI
ncbi:MAG: DUF2493 domain-containing protein [Bacteroidota bacterium]